MKDKQLAICIVSLLTPLITVSCFLITTPRGPLKFDPAVLPDAQVGVPYEARITISGNVTPVGDAGTDPKTLPPGLTIEHAEHENVIMIHGTPLSAGTYTFKLFAWCLGTNVSGQQGEQVYTLNVK